MRRDVIDTSAMPGIVEHFSIPALDAGGSELVDSVNIDSHKLRLLGGEILISRLNPRKPRVHLVPSALRAFAVASTEFVSLVPRGSEARFLRYYLLSETVRQHLDAQVRSATRSHQRVEPEVILRLHVPSFGRDAQRRIADFLDDRVSRIDQIIAARRGQAMMSVKAFEAWWDAEMLRLAERYSTVPMRRVLRSIADGPFGSSLTSNHYSDSGTRVIRLGNIGVASFRDVDQAFIPDEYAMTLSNHAVEPGDLVMAGLGDERWPLGRCALVPEIGPALVKADCYRIRLTVDVDHEFAAIALSSPLVRSKMAILGRGATRARLNTEVAREAPVVVPPPDVQRDWTQEWHRQRGKVEQIQRAYTRSIDLLTEYKSSLITAAVTGELDVTTAGSNIPG